MKCFIEALKFSVKIFMSPQVAFCWSMKALRGLRMCCFCSSQAAFFSAWEQKTARLSHCTSVSVYCCNGPSEDDFVIYWSWQSPHIFQPHKFGEIQHILPVEVPVHCQVPWYNRQTLMPPSNSVLCLGQGCSSIGRALAWHAADTGSIPWCGKGFFAQSQFSVQTLLWCLYTPVRNRVYLHLCAR